MVKEYLNMNIPSRKAVWKAGEVLRSENIDSEEYFSAIETLSQWRSLHAFPINRFQAFLRKKIERDKYTSVFVAQRLKRMPSIIAKLRRFDSMRLDRMQDIGGVRLVLKNMSDLERFHGSIMQTKSYKPELPPKNYIQEPKNDGYRSLHQVFRYTSKAHPELNNLRIELQIRTKLQHFWATAVEILGIVEKSSFKTGEGSEAFKKFFKLSSALFSLKEKKPVLKEYQNTTKKNLVHQLTKLEEELQVTTKLQVLAQSIKPLEKSSNPSADYHLMELDTEKRMIRLIPFSKKQLDLAETLYTARERETINNPHIFLLLISVGDVKAIKKAYPNYFLDTNNFIKNLQEIISSYR